MKMLQIPKGQRQYYFVLVLAAILVIITIILSVVSYRESTKQHIPVQPVSLSPTTFPSIFPQIYKPLTYNSQASKTLLRREEQRTPLSTSDTQAKEHILQLLPAGQNYGTVYSSPNIIIEYVQSLDLFQVEILTINVAAAKKEAEDWFEQEGMSQQGICNLPLGFYPGGNAAYILDEGNYIFNELPDGC